MFVIFVSDQVFELLLAIVESFGEALDYAKLLDLFKDSLGLVVADHEHQQHEGLSVQLDVESLAVAVVDGYRLENAFKYLAEQLF